MSVIRFLSCNRKNRLSVIWPKLKSSVFFWQFTNKHQNFLLLSLKEDPSNQGYSRVSTQDPGTLSSSTTSTSLDVDQSADGSKSQKPRPFTPIIEADDTNSNSFVEGFKELALSERAKRQKTTAKNSSRASLEEEEEDDKFEADPEAFQKNREHFQNKKSKSEHKSLILRVSLD